MQLVSQLTSNINAFMTKLSLFKSHMQSENFTHFPHCKAMKEKYPHMKMDYSDQVNTLLTSFNERFGEFQKYKIYLQLFSTPFDVKVEDAPPDVQLELIDIQCSDELKSQFKNSNLLTFYKELPDTSFPKLKDNARFCASMFGSTYVCEQAFSLMNLNKCKTRNRLTNENLENLLVVSTSAITPDIKKIAASIQISAIALIAWRSGTLISKLKPNLALLHKRLCIPDICEKIQKLQNLGHKILLYLHYLPYISCRLSFIFSQDNFICISISVSRMLIMKSSNAFLNSKMTFFKSELKV
ncbi:general transcription factor II-I repeat domain-containing protein 2-like isoform X2 [Centruroides sculpturatus]|uniref:general transcription factor II-I repeat domain-containing protein 2-like isoform X2 n=1 Tax=Centruroides sculpturatus TaxID=218467 RepID=UPI000C6E9768|nr:general transcription factor II-I repeat domain-containing protein 2-like isoform X2 [Centruroides sculpturatus]